MFTALEMEKTSTSDHRGVIRGQTRTRGEDACTQLRASLPHRGDECPVARYSAPQNDSGSPELSHGPCCLFDEGLDQRVLKGSRNGRARGCTEG
jgi:hypothetical protein